MLNQLGRVAFVLSVGMSPVIAHSETVAAEVQPGEDIIVTATQRSRSLNDVPIAVSAVSKEALQNSGGTDIRGLNQLAPSILISSSTSETVAAARVRGIGTVGDNAGLESSVATVIDGVYRARSGVALTELGSVESIQVLRGPQGTLFGRNASAGLINVVTEGPSRDESGSAEFSYGNYNYLRFLGDVTGPIGDSFAYRLDGSYSKRDGLLTDPATGKRYNDRNRFLVRGQLKYEPSSDLQVRLIGDFARRDEQCCAAVYQTARDARLVNGQLVYSPSAVASLERLLGAKIYDADQSARQVSVTPGRDYRSFVQEWGGSAQVDWNLGFAKLTSITAYRDWQSKRGQDADFNTLDLLYRTKYNQGFKTFSQELRLQGKTLGGRLDWLVGGYFSSEILTLTDNLRFGADYGRYASCLIVSRVAPSSLNPTQVGCMSSPSSALALLDTVRNTGATGDLYRQHALNYALFTHDIITITNSVSLTLGARYTFDRKTLDAMIASDPSACSTLRALNAGQIANLACANNITNLVDGRYHDHISDNHWSGTAVLSWKPINPLLTYVSYSRGYKAGGFNLDRAGLSIAAPNVTQLRFAAETVDAFEVGAKFKGRSVRMALTGFYERFKNFQLNTFNGTNFQVVNIEGCSIALDPSGSCSGDHTPGVSTKGVEWEIALLPVQDLNLNAAVTYAKTGYRDALTELNGRPLSGPLFMLPGNTLSNAPRVVVTGGATWTPEISASAGLRALFHVDFRFQSKSNTGSDLALEKNQPAYTLVNARVGLTKPDSQWSIELWAQNLFNTLYDQVTASAPLQPPASLPPTLGALYAGKLPGGAGAVANALFGTFLGEPRTFGVTVRTKF